MNDLGARLDWERIAATALFRDVDREAVSGHLEACSLRRLPPGLVLLDPGTPNSNLYLLLNGRLEVHVNAPVQPLLDVIEVGECAGELSVIEGGRPSARVLTSSESICLVIPHDILWAMIGASHALACNLLRLLARRVRFGSQAIARSRNQLAAVERSSHLDTLTNLHNRRWLEQHFPREMRRCSTAGIPLSLLILDMDDFKAVNDRCGHLAGDQLLRRAAVAIEGRLRANEMAARYGGDELLVLLPGASRAEARSIAARLTQAVAELSIPSLRAAGMRVSVTVGVAQMIAGEELGALLERADQDLYRRKRGADRSSDPVL